MLLLFLLKKVIIEFIFSYMSKDDAINIMKNANLNKISRLLYCYNCFSLHIRMTDATYYERNKDLILNRAKEFDENNKDVLREKARNKYRKLSDEGKNITREYGRNWYHNMSKKKKQIPKEYQKATVRLKSFNLVTKKFFNYMDLIL